MRSSTSSSNSPFTRGLPQGNWSAACLIAVVACLVVMATWEFTVRSKGYGPSLNDNSDRWAALRSKVGETPNQTVVIGASRIKFDLDLATYADYFGGEIPVQLAMVGTNPTRLLEHVAADEDFTGTLILGVTPALWFVPMGMPVENAEQAVGRFENWSPAQKVGLRLAGVLQKRLAFINPEDLTLEALLKRVPLSDRPGAQANLPPTLPAYFAYGDEYRQDRMWDQCDFGTTRARLIQQTWIPLFTPPPPPPHLTTEEFGVMMKENAERHLERIAAAVGQVRARGGKVVFVRPPSSGTLREMEQRHTPREQIWEAMLQTSGAPGIHFEDYAELSGFECPEWSHLTATDAVKFSQALMPLLAEALATQ